MKYLLLALTLLIPAAHAAPFLKSDQSTQKPTICTVFIDAAAGVDSATASNGTGSWCLYDISTLAAGAHTAKAKFATIDPVWGRVESGFSNVINFTRPVAPDAPTGIIISQ